MKHIPRKSWLIPLLLPPFLVLGIPAAISIWSGELVSLKKIVEIQSESNTETLFGAAYSSMDVSFKMKRVIHSAPQVLVVGSSRTLCIRKEFIKPGLTFYNGGRLASDIWVIRQVLEKLPADRLPKYLILGLDQYRFNPTNSNYRPELITPPVIANKFSDEAEGWDRFGSIWPSVIKDLFKGKIRPPPINQKYRGIGLISKMNASGFRNDGSYRYGAIIDTDPAFRKADVRIANCLNSIQKSQDPYQHGASVNPAVLDEVRILLDWCRSHRIMVTAFLPPYAPSVLDSMREPSLRFGYLEKIFPALDPIFRERGFQVFDFTHLPDSTDSEFIDGFHCSERSAAKILLKMAMTDSVAGEIVDTDRIKSLLSASTDPLVLVP